jgi:hypothetical protein
LNPNNQKRENVVLNADNQRLDAIFGSSPSGQDFSHVGPSNYPPVGSTRSELLGGAAAEKQLTASSTERRCSTSPIQLSYKKTSAYRVCRYLLEPIGSPLKYKWNLIKYANHSFGKGFDWDWRWINYNRIAAVNLLLSKKSNPVYLEIGCASNDLFDSVLAPKKVGVDPSAGGTIRATSDEFFATNQSLFDVIFIDGLHTYQQVRRDVVNSLRCVKDGGWIAIHDMLPRNWIEHHVPIISRGDWCGDVWKVAFELAQTEGIDFKILKIDHGVGVLRPLATNVILNDLTRELRDQEFSYFYENIDRLPIVEWQEARHWLCQRA